MKNIIFIFLFLLSATLSFAGIYRHDKDKKSYIELAHKSQFDCVGQIFIGDKNRGSCVLISKKYVLTAAHVFFDLGSPKNTRQYFFAFNGSRHIAKNITLHPLYATGGNYDIAIVELQEPIENVVPAVLCKEHNELHTDVVGVGFGAICRADDPSGEVPIDKPEKFAGENVVDSTGGYKVDGMNALLFCDFDCPQGCKYYGKSNKMGSSIPKDLEYTTNGGDSGGGLFRKGIKGWELVGICNGGGLNIDQYSITFYYGQVMIWTRVSAFLNWIKDFEQG